MNYLIEYDNTHNKIIKDEETSENKRIYYTGYINGVESTTYISSTRTICLKHLKADIKKEIKELKQNTKKLENALNKIEKSDK